MWQEVATPQIFLFSHSQSEAQQLEMVKKYGVGIGAPKREDRLRDAAQLHLRVGNLQKYCEIMAELGQWEKALSVAPGVSLHYWKSLSERWVLQGCHHTNGRVCLKGGCYRGVTRQLEEPV